MHDSIDAAAHLFLYCSKKNSEEVRSAIYMNDMLYNYAKHTLVLISP